MEIGSEFVIPDVKQSCKRFFLSGRTALDYIIRDLKCEDNIQSVLLPSWCCHTMIEPFVKNNIDIRFYEIFFDDERGLCAEIPTPQDNEVFYYMTYFGFSELCGLNYEYIRNRWKKVISDETHSWLSNKIYSTKKNEPDYSYISYRKWTGISGVSSVVKYHGNFKCEIIEKDSDKYNSVMEKARKLKKDYLNGVSNDKEVFLKMFNEAEKLLEKDYCGHRPSIKSFEQFINLDVDYIRKRRRKNAEELLKDLAENENINLIFKHMRDTDTPLFVPILVSSEKREVLKKFLILNKIYCPVHWSISDYHEGIEKRSKEIYNSELSIICDQRYDVNDMKYITCVIKSFFESN